MPAIQTNDFLGPFFLEIDRARYRIWHAELLLKKVSAGNGDSLIISVLGSNDNQKKGHISR